ncbi:ABC transporter substrate-binding protein [Microbacterium sp. SA39]|uniref:ABC transporter substrate-binding protein n=1 Tax=Microbacterium sp. SA39 TaxID=1263625 RepID=UPI0005FA093D|nr:ABC transporter substrate-binding protein [Microbacterium sp. SA39]KJQ54498.1 putative ABC transporter substrate-binding protein YesO [Microbacterium sp. SA39]
MKKSIGSAAGIAALALMLAGCSGSSAGDDKTIELWTSWTEGEATATALEPLIEEWAEENGYTVNQSNFTYDQIREKLIASAAGGNLPDVVWGLPEYVGEFGKLGILADVSDAWGGWEDASDVSDAVRESMTVDGQIVGFPYETTARAYLVHDELLGKAGVEVPETWDDVLAVGSSVEDATGSSFYGLTGAGVREPQELLVYLAQYGLSIAEEQEGGGYRNTWNDDPKQLADATKVFQYYIDLLDSGAVNPNSPTYGWEDTDENFATGLTASFVTGNWLAEREKTNADTMADVSIHPIPSPADGEPSTYIESKPIFVMAGSDSLEASTELAEQFASEDWQSAAFADRSALSTVTTDTKWNKDFAALIDTGVTYPPISLGEVTQHMIDAVAMVLQSGDSAEEAAIWLSDSVNQALENSGDAGGE